MTATETTAAGCIWSVGGVTRFWTLQAHRSRASRRAGRGITCDPDAGPSWRVQQKGQGCPRRGTSSVCLCKRMATSIEVSFRPLVLSVGGCRGKQGPPPRAAPRGPHTIRRLVSHCPFPPPSRPCRIPPPPPPPLAPRRSDFIFRSSSLPSLPCFSSFSSSFRSSLPRFSARCPSPPLSPSLYSAPPPLAHAAPDRCPPGRPAADDCHAPSARPLACGRGLRAPGTGFREASPGSPTEQQDPTPKQRCWHPRQHHW